MLPRTTLTRRLALPLACLVTLAARAVAQPEAIPDPCKTSAYTTEEQSSLQLFASRRLEAMNATDIGARERARRELVQPLRRPCASVAFRQALRAASLQGLTSLASESDESTAINALIVLGELADDQARRVVQGFTDDERVAVRYAAVDAMSRSFQAVNAFAPALSPTHVSEMVDHLAGRLEGETHAATFDAVVRALLDAASIARPGYEPAAAAALATLADHTALRLRTAPEEDRQTYQISALRVGEALRTSLSRPGQRPNPDASRAAAAFAGETLAVLACRANSRTLSRDSRALEVDLASIGEQVLVFSYQTLGSTLAPPKASAMLRDGLDAEFYAETRTLVLGLAQAPASLPEERTRRLNDALACR